MSPLLKLSDFDFELPESLIAQKPVAVRDRSRLMVLDRETGSISHDVFNHLPSQLPPHSLMVFNDTQVTPARLCGHIVGNGRPLEILLVKENEDDHWEALIKGLAKLKPGTEIEFEEKSLKAKLTERRGDRAVLKLTCSKNLQSVLQRVGKMPLPPYIKRSEVDGENLSALDRERYQTVFARNPGAIAAPTAGLHFTPELMKTLHKEGIESVFLTLHVGMGTFQPIRSENITEHKMDAERFHIPKETLKALTRARAEGRDIVAVGSTATRVLESVDPGDIKVKDTCGWTDRFIYPGQEFKSVDRLLTNFHLPKSTLYLLVCAFAGKELIEEAYRKAIEHNYRFFSYGDAMLIL
ncbi:S-adenosylmethionine:tRNA ribosyltransferase-isomerase [Candidatus Nitromaritima sp. SCGC AAA799-C22]|nr:S-adenosylmethionine:tRNA ribosyltransferase-isomerase [Candidatus Nitromaritima sp. SCGC AAA799-C22]